jgi:hypothetical protein
MKKYLSLCYVDGTCMTPHASTGIEMFQGKKIKITNNNKNLFFVFSKKFNLPPPPTKPSCTTAPPWGRGDWNAIEPPANTRDRTKFINWNFTFKLFSRNQERGACSISIQPTSGWNHRIRQHPQRGRRYGSRQHSYLVRKHLGSKLKSNLSECSYLHSLLQCRIRTSLPI